MKEIMDDVSKKFDDWAINGKAESMEKISYEEMLEMASLGAKVMQSNSVQQGMMNNVEIHVRSTFTKNEGVQAIVG